MKKQFLMLLAAVLLGSVSAMAQSNNIDPARADVNGDGIVDYADINAVLKIMRDGGGTVDVGGRFYLGTTKPTAANYMTLPGAVTTFTSIDDAVGATASVAAGETLYMLCPAAWVTEKNVALEDKSGNTIDFSDEKDAATISGYVIYKTQVWNAPNDVVLKTNTIYYFSVGTTEVTSSNYTTVNNATTTIPSTYTYTSTERNYTYLVVPSNKTVTMVDKNTNANYTLTEQTTINISNHKVYKGPAVAVGAQAIITLS